MRRITSVDPLTATESGTIAFAFSGNGSQWPGMGADLLAADPAFHAAVSEADEVLRPLLGWSVLAELAAPAGHRRPDTTDVVQPLLFAVQLGLVAALEAYGVRPAAVVGHSSGEMAAAHTAGALGLEAAARVVVERSRAQHSTAGAWGMAAVGTDAAGARRLLEPYAGRLEIAGINSGRDVTVSGDRAALARFGHELTARGVFFRDLGLDYAFHSHAMDGLQEGLLAALSDLKHDRPRIPYASATTGALLTGAETDARYWWRNLRQPVRFASAVDQLLEHGCDILVEISPHPVLSGYLRRLAGARRSAARTVGGDRADRTDRTEGATSASGAYGPAKDAYDTGNGAYDTASGADGGRPSGGGAGPTAVVTTLRRDTPGPAAVRTAVAHLLAAGARTDLTAFFPRPGRVVDLPAYPWQRERHWIGEPATWALGWGDGTVDHPLLGERAAAAEPLWHGAFEPTRAPWLADHRVGETVVMPATGFVDMALAAGRRTLEAPVEITNLAIPYALPLPFDDEPPIELQTTLSAEDGVLSIASRGEGGETWRGHARGRVRRLFAPQPGLVDLDRLTATLTSRRTTAEHYARAERTGLRYGPAFRVLQGDLLVGDGQVLAPYGAPGGGPDLSAYEAHPALLDGGLQAGAPLLEEVIEDGAPFLPVSIDRVRAWRRLPAVGHVRVCSRALTPREALWDITVLAANGLVCLTLEGVRLTRFDESARRSAPHWTTVMRAAPRPGQYLAPSPLPTPARIARDCAAELRRHRAAWHADGGARFLGAVRELTAHFAMAAIGTVLPGTAVAGSPSPSRAPGGLRPTNGTDTGTGSGTRSGAGRGEPFTVPDLLAAGVLPHYARLLDVLLETAHAHGLVQPVPPAPGEAADPRRWRTARPAAAQERFRAFAESHPGRAVDLTLLGTCGAHLADVLLGHRDPAELLFAEANRHLLEEFSTDTAMRGFANRTARTAMAALLRHWPTDRPLNILEVGAGSGGTAAALLPMLPATRTRYTVTDASAASFPRARSRFADHDTVDYRVFDLDRDPARQGLPEGGFDLVIADNALHTARDLRRALDHLGWLLADGGHLLAAETHDPAVPALLFGLLPGFWERRDTALRPHGPLLPAGGWIRLLAESGYHDAVLLGHDEGAADIEHSVLLAQRPHRQPLSAAAPPPVPARDAAVDSPTARVEPVGEGTEEAATDTPAPEDAAHDGRPRAWLIASEPSRDALADALAQRLATAVGPRVRRVTLSTDPEDWAGHLAERAGEPGRTGVVLLLGHDPADAATPPDQGPAQDPNQGPAQDRDPSQVHPGRASDPDRPAHLDRALRHAAVLRALALAVERLPGESAPPLWLVTPPTGVLPAPERPAAPANATAWGVARCLANEHPDVTVRRVSLDGCGRPETDAALLAYELLDPDPEDEILLTSGGRFVPRVQEVRDLAVTVPASDHPAFALRLRDPGRSYRLDWTPAEVPAPGPEEVLISVRAAALNYRDVLQALGALPLDARERRSPAAEHGSGMECAGVVTAVGSRVTAFAPGDRVHAFGVDTLRSHVTVHRAMVGHMPEGMDFRAAATLPVVFLTVHHALGHLARLAPGESVLVHGAAGGVGLAALQYAQRVRARVVATAGTPAKRDLLRLLGVRHVLDSRSLRFADRIKDLTEGQGVDVVLNSLAGEAISRGLEVLRSGGRFIELGKRDLYADGRLPLRPFLNNISFCAADLAGLSHDQPETVATRFAEVAQRVSDGVYRPIPHHVFPADRIAEAFEALQHSRHIGKVVISLETPPLLKARPAPVPVRAGAGYLITGGLSGLGAATARHLAARGAGHLALVGRRGADTPEAPALVAELRRRGATVSVHAADITAPSALRAVLDAVDTPEHPLRGVVHAAMVLDDAPLRELDEERMRRVLAPKAGGADTLDRLTRGRDLDFFVLCSSVAALIGNQHQANYTAANLHLEALARARRHAGAPALATAWGAIGDIGHVARHDLGAFMRQMGLELLPVDDVFEALETALARRDDIAVPAAVDWARLRHTIAGVAAPRFGAVLPPEDADADRTARQLTRALATATPEEALTLVSAALADILARILHTDPDQVRPDRRLDQLGLDSLMGAELMTAIHQRLGCNLPAVEIVNSATVGDLAQRCVRRLARTTPGGPVPGA
ncbi:SDR family NAD(P)-dependent oxidoreductase [Streptomyces sp. URMC 123]|uniref:SDR family NAD(P)-dependent oxidoreductase n=1 Tax=Streptomyces sp. URMC 123 TaxID=3423403 RepID=UPI003F19C446